VVDTCEHGNEPSSSMKGGKFHELLASQESLCSVELVEPSQTLTTLTTLTVNAKRSYVSPVLKENTTLAINGKKSLVSAVLK